MKTEHWIVVVFVAFFAGMVGVFAASAWTTNYSAKPLSGLHDLLHRDLGLSTEQKTELEGIEGRFAKRKAVLEVQLRVANAALANAIKDDKANSPAVQAAIDDFHEAMGELQKVTIRHVFEVRELLTEEQSEVFDAEVVRALTEL